MIVSIELPLLTNDYGRIDVLLATASLEPTLTETFALRVSQQLLGVRDGNSRSYSTLCGGTAVHATMASSADHQETDPELSCLSITVLFIVSFRILTRDLLGGIISSSSDARSISCTQCRVRSEHCAIGIAGFAMDGISQLPKEEAS
jgi:hypothetical protein